MKIYNGSCHCGAVRFRFRSDEIANGIRCNCSICVRRGCVMSTPYFVTEDFDALEGLTSLTLYQWGDHDVKFWFCRVCGIHPFSELTAKPGHYRVNLGCLDGLDVLALPIKLIDGKSF